MPFEQLFARLLVLVLARVLLKCQQMAEKFILSYILTTKDIRGSNGEEFMFKNLVRKLAV
jgi:hypothetical protein